VEEAVAVDGGSQERNMAWEEQEENE